MKQLSPDIVLVEGDNTLNVEMVPIAPPFDPWVYDVNGDGIIDRAEYIQALWDYYDGKITKEQVEQVRALWEAGVPPEELLPAELSNLRAAPEIVTIGQKVTIKVNVGNPNWETSITHLVQLTGVIHAEKEVTLAPHETKTVTFIETVTWQAWGTIYCDGLSVRVKGEVYVPPEEEPPPPYTDELRREISRKYKEFLDQLSIEACGDVYMSHAWFSELTMQEKHDLTVQAEDMARQWFFNKYGYWWPF